MKLAVHDGLPLRQDARAAAPLCAADSGVTLAFGGVSPTSSLLVKGDERGQIGRREQLIVDLLERLNDPEGEWVTWQEGTARLGTTRTAPPRDSDQWPFPTPRAAIDFFVESMPLDAAAVLSSTTMQMFVWLPVAPSATSRSSTKASGGRGRRATGRESSNSSRKDGYGFSYFVTTTSSSSPSASRRSATASLPPAIPSSTGSKGEWITRPASVPEARKSGCRTVMLHREREPEDSRPPEEGTDARGNESAFRTPMPPASRSRKVSRGGSPTRPKKTCGRRSASRRDPGGQLGFNRRASTEARRSAGVREVRARERRDHWYKYVKCTSIDPSCLPGEEVHRIRLEEMRKLIIYKFTRYPLQTFRLLRRFVRFMPLRDVLDLIVKPFLGKEAARPTPR